MGHPFPHNILAVLFTLFGLVSTDVPCFCQTPSIAIIAKENSRAVVTIVVLKNGERIGSGTGFAVGADGIIATNYHVIRDASEAHITLANGDTYDSVFILDVDKVKDLALLRIKALNC